MMQGSVAALAGAGTALPALPGEAQNGRASGCTIGGKVLAFGYMKGIVDGLGLNYA
jgi:hypothetical protein